MSTGIITTDGVTEASPAGSYAHIANRAWTHDGRVEEYGADPETCDDIGEQLMLQSPGIGINVILGGGRGPLTPNTLEDPEVPGLMGHRKDGHDFPSEWLNKKLGEGRLAEYVTLRSQLLEVDTNSTEYLLGLFAPENLEFVDKQETNNDPSLAEMTEVALKILSKNPNGFFLFVEGTYAYGKRLGFHTKR